MQKLKLLTYGLIAILMTGLTGGWAGAQDIEFVARAEKVLRVNEQFQLEYTANKSIDDFTPPDFGDFRYLGGPMTGSSRSISMVNGRTTQEVRYTYTYYLQAPSKPGNYTIQPAKAVYKRDRIESNAIQIEVVGNASQGSNQGNQSSAQQPDAGNTADNEQIFLRLEPEKRSAYVGEQIGIELRLYTKLNVGNAENLKIPDFTGFYNQEVDFPEQQLERTRLGNEIYYTALVSKSVLYPQRTGELTIGEAEMTLVVQERTGRQTFFGPEVRNRRVLLKSKPVSIRVKPLPPGKPAGFNGAVGQFSINGRVSSTETSTNDAITFKINVSGKGNLKLLEDLTTPFPPTFTVFDPVKNVSLNAGSGGRSGTVSYEYTAIPRHEGTFNIPPFQLTYFDPVSQSYKTASTTDFVIQVARGENDTTRFPVNNLSQEDIQMLGTDIRYIKTKTRLRPSANFIYSSGWFVGAYIALALVFIILLLFRREQIRKSANVAQYRNKRAGRTAYRRLRHVRKIMSTRNEETFYEELGKALWDYLSDKLSIPVSSLSRENVSSAFVERNLDAELSRQFFEVVEACEFARFAPGAGTSDMRDLYNRAAGLINRIDQKL